MHHAHRPFLPLLALCAAVSLLLTACAGARGFERPNGVALAAGGTNSVRIFGSEGQLLATLLGDGSPDFAFVNPGDVAVDDTLGRMYISDFTLGNLLQFSLDWIDPAAPRIEVRP